MHKLQKVMLSFMVLLFAGNVFAFGTGNMPVTPSGWTLRESYTNVRIYQKGTEQVYAQVVDIRGGAKVRFIHPGKQGTNPVMFTRYTLDTIWGYSSGQVSMVNGQFFNSGINPTTLSFGVRANSSLLTYGEDKYAYPANLMKQIEFYEGGTSSVVGVNVTQWNESQLNSQYSAQNIMVGLDPGVAKSPDSSVARLYMCSKVNPAGPTSPAQWLVVLSAQSSTQSTTLANINAWGCNGTIMFDGSGSSQLKTSGGIRMKGSNGYWLENRDIPQAIAIYNN